MPTNIDSLSVDIQSNSSKAVSGLDALVASLGRIKAAASGGAGLSTVAKSIERISAAVNGPADSLNKFARLSQSIKALDGIKLSTTISNRLSDIGNAIGSFSADANYGGIDQVADSLKRLDGVKVSKTLGNSLTNITNALNQVGDVKPINPQLTANLNALGQSMQSFAGLEKIQFNGVARLVTALGSMGKVKPISNAVFSNVDKLAAAINRLNSATAGIATNRLNALAKAATALAPSMSSAAKSTSLFGGGITASIARLGVMWYSIKRVAGVVKGWIDQSNAFVENTNLFTVAMGKYADEAMAYAEKVQDAAGIDMSEWIRNQGVFMQLATGFGIVRDKAYSMSKTLTQLGYDISSYFNISVSEAMTKLQSGIAGEIEPLRRLGYALSQAKLQEIALSMGIEQKVANMTEADKGMLRYIAIMQQSTNAIGDMARTIMTPANAMRVLEGQVVQLTRALGNLFIPILIEVIPYVIAFVKVITMAIQSLATLLGYKMVEIDYSSIDGASDAMGDLGDSVGDATDKAKELKNQLAGFDEINLIQSQSGGGSGSGGGSSVDWDAIEGFDMSKFEYDFLKGLQDQINSLIPLMEELLDWALLIGAAILAWSFAKALADAGLLAKLLGSALAIILEFTLGKMFMDDFFRTGEIGEYIKALIVTAIGSAFLYKLWGPAGLAVGVGVGIAFMLTSLSGALSSGITSLTDWKAWLTMATTTAFGGIAGLALSKTIGVTALSGALMGLTLSLGLTFMIANASAVAGDQFGAGSLESILMSIVSTIAFGAAGYLTLGLGPAGWAVGIAVGIVLNIISLSIAIQEQIKKASIDTFFDGQGVQLDELADSYNGLMQSMIDAYQPTIDSWAALKEGKPNIEDVRVEFDYMMASIESGNTTAKEKIPEIRDLFKELSDDSIKYLQDLGVEITASLSGRLGEVVEGMGGQVDTLKVEFAGLVGEATKRIAEIDVEVEALTEAFKNNKISAEEYGAKMKELNNEKASFTQTVEDANELKLAFDELNAAAKLDIDFGSIDLTKPESLEQTMGEINTQFEGVATKAEEARLKSEEMWTAETEKWTEMLNIANQLGDVDAAANAQAILDVVIPQGRAEDLATIDGRVNEFVGTVGESLVRAMGDQISTAELNWEELDFFEKMLVPEGKAGYIESAINSFKDNIVAPISDKMKTAFGDDFGAEGAVVAADAVKNNIITRVSEISFEGVTLETKTLTGSIESSISAGLEALKEISGAAALAKTVATETASSMADNKDTITDAGAEWGKNSLEGYAQGVKDNLKTATDAVTNAFSGTTDSIHAAVQTADDQHSPSQKWWTFAQNDAQGFADGIIDNKHLAITEVETMISDMHDKFTNADFSSGLDTMFNKILTKTETFTGKFTDAINDMLSNWKSAMSSININQQTGAMTYTPMPKVTIPRFAQGGFPEDGLFYANSRELVGKFANGRTAVANNEQITTGIYEASYAANKEGNDLLRIQNELLRRLVAASLSNGGGGSGSSDVERGREIDRLLGEFRTASGSAW